MSSSIPSWQILTVHAQPFRGVRDLAFCLKVALDSLLVWASSGDSGETARMRRLAWTFAARIGDKYQICFTQPVCQDKLYNKKNKLVLQDSFLNMYLSTLLSFVWPVWLNKCKYGWGGDNMKRENKASTCYKIILLFFLFLLIFNFRWSMPRMIEQTLVEGAGRNSLIRCASAWYADGSGFKLQVRKNILSLRFGHENVSLSSADSRMAVVSYWQKNGH